MVALVATSCGPAASEEEEGKTIVGKVVEKEAPEVKDKEEEIGEEKVHEAGEPKYGGVFTFPLGSRTGSFDEHKHWRAYTTTTHLTNEELIIGDWARGPAGTGETSWTIQGVNTMKWPAGALAESWELPDDEIIIFHIRQEVYWHNKPPVNGRELTADDVVYTLKRLWFGEGMDGRPGILVASRKPEQRPVSIMAPDKWTAVIKCPPGEQRSIFGSSTDYCGIVAREMVEKWGDLTDWRSACGTGPFMLVDHVDNASTTLVRHPNYWMKDPVHPENTLPYLDDVKFLIIPDASTQMAGLRTGKLDCLHSRTREDTQSLLNTNPELQYDKYLSDLSWNIYMRVDKPELPFHDIRVRYALAMAIDNQAIKEEIYGGDAEVFTHPVMPVPDYSDVFIPLEELPESIRKLYEYHPEEAKQLLAEAGYPNGFKVNVLTSGPWVDQLSIIKAYWAEIGFELDIQVTEYLVL